MEIKDDLDKVRDFLINIELGVQDLIHELEASRKTMSEMKLENDMLQDTVAELHATIENLQEDIQTMEDNMEED